MLARVDLGIEAYAQLMVELAAAGDARAAVLARHGLDEDRWAEIDASWQEQLSEALDEEGDGVADLLVRYTAAYEAAQRALGPVISLELFARATRLFQASGDMRGALAKTGVTFSDYVRASEHWSRRMTEDPDLEQRFHDVLRGGVRS